MVLFRRNNTELSGKTMDGTESRRILRIGGLMTILLAVLLYASAADYERKLKLATPAAATYYVAPDGNDTNRTDL